MEVAHFCILCMNCIALCFAVPCLIAPPLVEGVNLTHPWKALMLENLSGSLALTNLPENRFRGRGGSVTTGPTAMPSVFAGWRGSTLHSDGWRRAPNRHLRGPPHDLVLGQNLLRAPRALRAGGERPPQAHPPSCQPVPLISSERSYSGV